MSKKRVLYAEDELTNRRLIQIRLKDEGIDCDVAENGQEALQLYREHTYDMVILDHYMPRMNGDKVAKEIRIKNTVIPIIGITSDDESAEYLRICGFNDVIVKPITGYASIARILNYLRDD
ncbi:MAG: response regulator [Spirochaetota bacterium]